MRVAFRGGPADGKSLDVVDDTSMLIMEESQHGPNMTVRYRSHRYLPDGSYYGPSPWTKWFIEAQIGLS